MAVESASWGQNLWEISNGLAVPFAEDGDRSLLKEVVKKGSVDLQQRVVPVAAIARWYEKISGMESQVGDILGEEREEKELRRAEMEAQKAANMIEHESEIYSRPAQTWFQSEREKRDVAAQAKDAALDILIQKKIDKNTSKSARRMERKIAASKEEAAAAAEKQQGGVKVKWNLMAEFTWVHLIDAKSRCTCCTSCFSSGLQHRPCLRFLSEHLK